MVEDRVKTVLEDIEKYRQRQKQLGAREVIEMYGKAKELGGKEIILHSEMRNKIMSDS